MAYFPFVHLERKFMHLGFHIYDVGFQSPNVEAARPLVYATALMLVAIIMVLNLTAIANPQSPAREIQESGRLNVRQPCTNADGHSKTEGIQ
jgi:ABC-type phosphate transport system permease subunit